MREPDDLHILLERTDEPDCRFVAAWLIKAAEAQEFWSEALTDPEFSDQISLIHVMATPHLAAFALEILGELERSRHVAALGLYSDEIGLFCSELTLLVRLGFFVCAGTSYHMAVPDTITLAKVKQAALDVLSTVEDEGRGDGIEILLPERLLHTLPQAEAEAWRSRLIAIRESEQSKEAEIVRLPKPAQIIWIDWSTGQTGAPEPIEHGGHVIPFTAPRGGLRGKRKITDTSSPCPQFPGK